MKILSVELGEIRVPLRTPFKTSLRTVDAVHDVVVMIKTDNGLIGYGEAPPTAVITGETRPSIREAIEGYIGPKLIGQSIFDMENNQILLHSAILGNTSAKAAVDMALYDLWSQALGVPLYKALGGNRKQIETDLTISVNDVDEMVSDSLEAIRRGFKVLKVKIGKDEELDLKRIVAIRKAVGEEAVIRLDANQGWSVREALSIIDKLEKSDLNIELIEQPIHYSNLQGMIEVTRHSSIPIMADESVFGPMEALEVIEKRAADIINIKLMKTGGIHEALKIVSLAEIHKIPCMIGCMLESKISVSAAAHLAAAKNTIVYVDLDGPGLCSVDPVLGGPSFNEAQIIMNDTPGLGFEAVDGLSLY
ncbi:MAG: dipeptide epimerase [Tissierellia bacterium]|nr:dipeptide epimerase [Tissierellia bacterium]